MNFIDPEFLPLTVLDKSYNPYLVALSIIIAIISSFTAFGSLERINACTDRLHQTLWVMFGAVSMGIGIWATHFIGSLALILPISVSYNLNITILSVIPAIMASTVVFWLMNQTNFNLKYLFFCGVLLGAGIGIGRIGGSAMEAARVVESLGGKIVGVAALANRGFCKRENSDIETKVNCKLPQDIPFFALADFTFEMYAPEACPLCKDGSEAIKPGSRGN